MRQQQKQARKVIAYFDGMADDYADEYDSKSNSGYSFQIRKQRVLELFDQDGGKVLDVGSGPGVMIEDFVHSHGCEYWGIDVSEDMIRVGLQKYSEEPRVHFALGYIENLDFGDNFFDAVICMGVITMREKVNSTRYSSLESSCSQLYLA